LLLPEPSVLKQDAQVAARCVPTDAVGGDFYTFNRLGLGVVAVMLGDVASHGFPAALVMAAVMAAAGIQAGSGASPDATLKSLHDTLGERLSFADTYLTVFYGILDPGRQLLTWASAGHPYAFRVPRAGSAERLETTAPPLGLGASSEIGVRSVRWDAAHDLLCLWTDGLVDAAGPTDGAERFGEGRLIELVERHRTESPQEIVTRVMAAVEQFAPVREDDRTLLVLRR
jgi:serine phosphatase RsbU (regulator of sigma subunit)